MGRVTIYLSQQTERWARAFARADRVSLGRWIAQRIEWRARSEWPAAIRALAGAWTDLPPAERIRRRGAKDIVRARL